MDVDIESGGKTLDARILQFASSAAWVILGLLGWSLTRQVDSFENKVARLTETQQLVGQSLAEIRTNTGHTVATLLEIREEQRRRADQVSRLDAIVTELTITRREDRQAKLIGRATKGPLSAE